MLSTVCSTHSQRLPSDAEDRLSLVESPGEVCPDLEVEVPFARCSDERDQAAKVFHAMEASDAGPETSSAVFNASPIPEVAAVQAADHGVEHSTEPAGVTGPVTKSSETDPECKVPVASAKGNGYALPNAYDRTEMLLKNLAEFSSMPIPEGAPFSIELRMMFQILESSAQQQKLLHQVSDRVEYMQLELEQRLDDFQGELSKMGCTPWPQTIHSDPPQPERVAKEVSAETFVTDHSLTSTFEQPDCISGQASQCIRHYPLGCSLDAQQQPPFSKQSSPTSSVTEVTAVTYGQKVDGYCEHYGTVAEVTETAKCDEIKLPQTPPGNSASDAEDWICQSCSHRNVAGRTVCGRCGDANPTTSEVSCDKPKMLRRGNTSEALGTLATFVTQQAYTEVADDNYLRKMISHHYFDALCAVVITANAVTIGIQAQLDIDFALNCHELTPNLPKSSAIEFLDRLYMAFYFSELTIKLAVFRCKFFSGPDHKWNIFDFILVIAGIYDLVMEFTNLSFGGDFGFTWLRMVRLLKMLKMLRVVRVMRFFQQLRLMVTSIAGSLTTLFWSVVMMGMIMYTFGLCFLQAVTSHLTQEDLHMTELGEFDETREGIQAYWSSILQSVMTLYFAVTGGADWEQLAAPIKTSDPIFYGLFFVYIMFMSVAVLNVLTGMFVDKAMKVSEQDEESVIEELEQKPEIAKFRRFVKAEAHRLKCEEEGIPYTGEPEEDEEPTGDSSFITWAVLTQEHDNGVVSDFYSALEIGDEDGKRVFRTLDPDKTLLVDLDEFVRGCLAAKGSMVGLHIAFLVSEVKRLAQQLTIFTLHAEDRFEDFDNAFGDLGADMPCHASLRQKYVEAKFVHAPSLNSDPASAKAKAEDKHTRPKKSVPPKPLKQRASKEALVTDSLSQIEVEIP